MIQKASDTFSYHETLTAYLSYDLLGSARKVERLCLHIILPLVIHVHIKVICIAGVYCSLQFLINFRLNLLLQEVTAIAYVKVCLFGSFHILVDFKECADNFSLMTPCLSFIPYSPMSSCADDLVTIPCIVSFFHGGPIDLSCKQRYRTRLPQRK